MGSVKRKTWPLNTYIVAEGGIGSQWIGTLAVALGDIEHVAQGIGGKQTVEVCSVDVLDNRCE